MSNKEKLEQRKEAKAVEEQQAAAQEAKVAAQSAIESKTEAKKEDKKIDADKKAAKPSAKAPAAKDEKKEPKREVVLQRNYVIPLMEAYAKPATKRAKRAVKLLREFLQRHMKSQEVKIDPALSRLILSRGMTRPPKSLRVKASKDKQGIVLALPG